MPVVHVMRHGQVDNPTGVLYERLPGYHLTELGHQMAEMAAEFFSDLPITHLRCSPLERAQETMAPLAARFPTVPVITDERVIEAGSHFAGQVMGSTASAARLPKNWPILVNPLKPSWGEPYAEIAQRMKEGILAAAALLGPGEQAVVVSHQLPIWMLRQYAEGKRLWHDPRKRQCTLASVTSFQVTDDQISFFEYAEPARDLIGTNPHNGFGA